MSSLNGEYGWSGVFSAGRREVCYAGLRLCYSSSHYLYNLNEYLVGRYVGEIATKAGTFDCRYWKMQDSVRFLSRAQRQPQTEVIYLAT